MEKRDKLIYWISTSLLAIMMLMSSSLYIFKNQMVRDTFETLGYPSYLIYPLAIAKILGLVAIITKKSSLLKGLAYAGFFFDFLLSLAAHLSVGDGDFIGAIIGLVLLTISYMYERKLYASYRRF